MWSEFERRHDTIRRFQQISMDLFRMALAQELEPEVGRVLLNDALGSWREEFHRRLLEPHWTLPCYFRTDEAAPGQIVEIQCPGSLWGDHQLVADLAESWGVLDSRTPKLAERFSESVLQLLGGRPPFVHHLLDNASGPHTMRYFINCTRSQLKYHAWDPGIKPQECSLVRSHSFYGLMAENFALPRLTQCLEGTLIYDFPPHVLFDQKATLALPFWHLTASHFDEEIRSIILYNDFVTPAGFTLENGESCTLESFAMRPRRERRYFLKYAGCDVSINWGSRGVISLSNCGRDECLARLQRAAAAYERGQVWTIQLGHTTHEEVSYYDRNGALETKIMTPKFSGFYGPFGLLGVLLQHRRFYKVHGNEETAVSIVMP
jgi:hypothetical protein